MYVRISLCEKGKNSIMEQKTLKKKKKVFPKKEVPFSCKCTVPNLRTFSRKLIYADYLDDVNNFCSTVLTCVAVP